MPAPTVDQKAVTLTPDATIATTMQVTQIGAEVFASPIPPPMQATQLALEMWASVALAPVIAAQARVIVMA